jgi:hypothetical protein
MTQDISHSNKTIAIMPESGGNLLCLRFSGIVTLEDHSELCEKPLYDILGHYKTYRFLAFYEDFTGWTPEAADRNFKLINDIHPRAERVAYVNPPERKVLQMSLQKATMTPVTRFFDTDDLGEALLWIQDRT